MEIPSTIALYVKDYPFCGCIESEKDKHVSEDGRYCKVCRQESYNGALKSLDIVLSTPIVVIEEELTLNGSHLKTYELTTKISDCLKHLGTNSDLIIEDGDLKGIYYGTHGEVHYTFRQKTDIIPYEDIELFEGVPMNNFLASLESQPIGELIKRRNKWL